MMTILPPPARRIPASTAWITWNVPQGSCRCLPPVFLVVAETAAIAESWLALRARDLLAPPRQ
jgi:hypothetical protein